VGFAFQSGAKEALIYDSLARDDREARMKRAMGLIGGASGLAFFVAPLLGALIVSELALSRFLLAIFLTACSVSVAFFVSLTLGEPQEAYARPEQSSLAVLRNGVDQLRNNRRLQWIAAIVVLTSSFSNTLVTLYQPYFAKAAVPAFWIGAAWSLGALLASAVQRYVHLIDERLSRYGLLLTAMWPAAMYFLLAAVSHPLLLVPVFIVAYGSMEAKRPLLASYRNREIDSRSRATVLSLMNMLTKLYVAALTLVIGRIADVSIPLAFCAIGTVISVSSLVLRVDRVAPAFSRAGEEA